MKVQKMNLNIRYDLPKEIWDKVIPEIYKETEGWLGFATGNLQLRIGLPHWFSFNDDEKYVTASVEPSGLQFFGQMNDDEWENWKTQIYFALGGFVPGLWPKLLIISPQYDIQCSLSGGVQYKRNFY